MTGIYIHIPFCTAKCPYCDFYSFKGDEKQKDSYLKAVLCALEGYADKNVQVDTVYFGGGTPSVFGGKRIGRVIEYIKEAFAVTDSAEITVECNPSSVDEAFVKEIKKAGANRISMGMQSAVKREREILGRKSDRADIERVVGLFRKEGIENISLDLMLGVPFQTQESVRESMDFLLGLDVKHISAYMLKIEEGTPFERMSESLTLPDEDETADMYLFVSEYLRGRGFSHYEISNFAREGYESRHNLKYWHCEEYIGIGPSAHSFYRGKRFYYERSFDDFLSGKPTVADGEGGSEEEYIMLALRLREGLIKEKYEKRFRKELCNDIIKRAEKYEKKGLMIINEKGIALTSEGYLLSNTIISDLLYDF